MANKTAGIRNTLLRPELSGCLAFSLLLGRELLGLSVIGVTLLRHLLDRLVSLWVNGLLIALGNRLKRLYGDIDL